MHQGCRALVAFCGPADRQPAAFDERRMLNQLLETPTMWTKPEYTEMRFGFEVTMYIANR